MVVPNKDAANGGSGAKGEQADDAGGDVDMEVEVGKKVEQQPVTVV